ncbi:putative aspartic peptidase domain superfamily [Helianthus annuus]|nr:putative aspartic peptidase domain superfamily [Helianthus annuus]
MEAPGKVQPRLIPESTAHTGGPSSEKSVGKKPVQVVPSPNVDISRAPFPSRLKNQTYSKEYGKFLEIFKQLRINLPFIEALQSMPKYAKFLKDLLKRKDRLGEVSNIPLSGGCSAVVLNKVPEKLTDPGLFTIPCLFRSDTECRALADLGASINLMPYSLYERLGLGELSPTRMSLSLADRSVKYPRGIIENLLVKVDKFVFPVDFVVLDMEADEKVPIILGRPFLCTAKAVIDVFDGKITLQVGEERVSFEIARSMDHPSGSDDLSSPCHSVYFIESFLSCVDHCFDYISGADLVKSKLDEVVDKVEEVANESEEAEENEWVPEVLELSEVKSEVESTPLEKPAPLELKVLPSHLEYAFIGEGSNFPVIISSKLEEGEKGRLLEEDERSEKEVVSGPSLEEAIGPKCGDPPDRRVDDLGKRVKCLEFKIDALSKAQCGDKFRFEMYKFKPPDDGLRDCDRHAGVQIDSDNSRYDGATAREVWYGCELRLYDPP